ncbi:MAG: ABC transporter ATP-binding protein [bacterium]
MASDHRHQIKKNMDSTEPTQAVLHTNQLTKRFGDTLAVDNLSLEIVQGEVFGFLGPNGAGKTTSIGMICGLLKADSGEVWIHQQKIDSRDRTLRTRIGFCPQQIVLWGMLTCLEQLEFIGTMYGVPGAVARQRGNELLALIGLEAKRNKLAKTLSGGMQRRLNLIMALVHNPEIVVLDEPEAGLDPQSRVLVREYLQSLAGKKTIILTTHNMDEADRVADRVAIIDHGRLLKLDTPAQLKRSIGEGDVLEIEVFPREGIALETVLETIKPLASQVSLSNHILIIRARWAAELLPSIMERLKTAGFQTGEIRLRENSLEDVFITLTGRRLRE